MYKQRLSHPDSVIYGKKRCPCLKCYLAEVPKEDIVARILSHTVLDPVTGCRIWNGSTISRKSGGERRMNFGIADTTLCADRLMYRLCVKEIDRTVQVYQTCGNDVCVEPSHLRSRTVMENNPNLAKYHRDRRILSPEQIREMRALADDGWSFSDLSERYGIDRGTARNVVVRRSYKDVE